MIKEMQNKASTNTVHLMNQLAASSPTPSKTVLISMKLHLLQTRCYERGKRKKKIQKADCKYFAWQLLSCHWEVAKVEEREEERSFTVTTLIAVDVILSVSSGSRDSEPVLKWYWKCTQCFSSQELQFQNMEGLLILRTYFHHLCVLEWRKKRRMSSPTTPCLFLVSLLVLLPPEQQRWEKNPATQNWALWLSTLYASLIRYHDGHSAPSTSITSTYRYIKTEKQNFQNSFFDLLLMPRYKNKHYHMSHVRQTYLRKNIWPISTSAIKEHLKSCYTPC